MSSNSPLSAAGRRPGTDLKSDRIFRLLVESITDYAIFVLDPNGHIATWNPGAERFKGYKAEEIIGKHFSVFYRQEDVDAGKPPMELEVAAREGRFEDEGWRVRKNGTKFWANVVITRLLDQDGSLLGFGKITRDLTQRRLAEQRFRLLIEGVEDYAIYSLDKDGFVTSWNAGAERIKGYTGAEIVGQHFSRFYTPEDAEAGIPQSVLAKAMKDRHYEGEGWRVRKDGTRFWSSVVVTPVFDDDGQIAGFSKITRDVTDRKMLLDQIRSHAAELEVRIAEREATNAELEAFSYSVSHDLRAPLRAIEGFSSALLEDHGDKLDDEGKDFLSEIQKAALRMNRLVEDLLNYSRLGRIDLALTDVNVLQSVQRSAEVFGRDLKSLQIEMDPTVSVLAHEATLGQVLANLLGNAKKFLAEGVKPQIRVTAQRVDEGRVRICVTDNGIGIAPQHLDRVFKVFEQLHSIDTYPGTGIGLAIVHRAIMRMGGTVGVESKPGQGSTFWIELPEARRV